MVNILEERNIVEVVLNKLSKLGNLPNDGFLCGGAVANMLLSLKWGEDYPINDLDIFVETKNYKHSRTPLRTDSLVIEGGYNHLNLSYNHGNNYRIVSSERDGLINIVKVYRENRDKSKNYMYILKGFDLNCTQVGIDLKTGDLLYTSEFEQFLNDKQLKVSVPYTPSHTVIRLFKKIDELNCYCDVESQMKLLSQPFINPQMVKYDNSYTGIFAMFFGIKYKEMYDKYKDKVEPYFKLVSFFEYKKTMWEKRWEMNNTEDAKTRKKNHVLNWLDPNRNPSQSNLEYWTKFNGKMWGLLPVKYTESDVELFTIMGHRFTPLILKNVWDMLYGGLKKSTIKKIKTLFKYEDVKDLCIVNNKFYDCDFSEKQVKELNDYISSNKEFSLICYKYRLNFQDSFNLKNEVIKFLNVEGIWFSNMVHNLILNNGNSMVKPNTENIKDLFEKEKKRLTKPLIEGVDLSGMKLPKCVDVKELVSEYDLSYAGKKLSNCINNPSQNYREKIIKNQVKIFLITTPNSMSALEINSVVDNNGITQWKERWVLSYCNKDSNLYHKQISNYILNYINREFLLVDISNKLKLIDENIDMVIKNLDEKNDISTKDNPVNHLPFDDLGLEMTTEGLVDTINVTIGDNNDTDTWNYV